MAEELLRLEGLSKYYTSSQSVVVGLNGITLTFHRGEFVAVTGESGSGKSTLAHVLGGILPYEGGELFLRGKPTSHYDSGDWENYRRDCVSFISQDYGILPGSTVMANVVSALRLAGMDRALAREQAEAILRKVELWELKGRRAAKLSSGQKQRLSIARALAKPASILIADEPTGNLDGENSAKVIGLLAEAAKERLVILITHEFSEAEALVTRHICLQDGRVTMDARLREPNEPSQAAPRPAAAAKRRGMGVYIAGLQLRSRPVWSVLMLLFFSLTVFAVFAFAGTFIVALDDTNTRIYDDSAFQNGNDRRIVVCTPDGSDMTAADEAALLGVDHVEYLERYGYLADIKYAFREDVDYSWRYTVDWPEDASHMPGAWASTESVILSPSAMSFAQTVPQFADGRDFLTGGRLPENLYEVVAVGDESMIGQAIPVYFQDSKNWAQKYYVCIEVTVVGVTGYGSGLYFHDDVGRVFLNHAKLLNTGNYCLYLPALDLNDGEFRLQAEFYERLISELRWETQTDDPVLRKYFLDLNHGDWVMLVGAGAHYSSLTSLIEISQADYDRLALTGQGDQITLMMEDYAYTDRVLEDLYELGYAAVSPYREGSTVQDPELAAQRMQTLRICLIALAVVAALQVVVLRAMFSLQLGSYRLLSHIGLDGASARRSLLWQVLLFALCGQALGLLAILLCGSLGVESVGKLLRYLSGAYRVLLSALHLGVSLLAAAWSMSALRRQVYPDSGSAPDLDWSVWEQEVDA